MKYLLLIPFLIPVAAQAQFGSGMRGHKPNDITRTPDTHAPAVPQNLIASGGDGQISLSWTASVDDDTEGYNVCIDTDGEPFSNCSDVGNVTSHFFEDLTNGTEYFIGVSAYDEIPNESDYAQTSATPSMVEHSSYAQLAADEDCGTGAVTTMGGDLGGTFTGQATDPSPGVANEHLGIGIECANGNFWRRQFTYNEDNPIELKWFTDANGNQWSNGDDATPVFQGLGADFPDELYIRMPDTYDVTLQMGTLDWTSQSRIGIYEAGADVLDLKASNDQWLETLNTEYLVLGSLDNNEPELTISGHHPPEYDPDECAYPNQIGRGRTIRAGWNSTVGDPETNVASIRLNGDNIKIQFADISGSRVAIDTVYISGWVNTSGWWVTNAKAVRFDNARFGDSSLCNWRAAHENPPVTGFQIRKRTKLELVDKIVGDLTLQYGVPILFFAKTPHVGEDADHRFKITEKDIGVAADGTFFSGGWHGEQAWKVDPILFRNQDVDGPPSHPEGEPSWWLHHIGGPHDYHYEWGLSFKFEATNQGAAGEFLATDANVLVENAGGDIQSSIQQGGSHGADDDLCDEGECNLAGWNSFSGGGGVITEKDFWMGNKDTLRDGTIEGDLIFWSNHHLQWDEISNPIYEGNWVEDIDVEGKIVWDRREDFNGDLNEAAKCNIDNNQFYRINFPGSAREVFDAICQEGSNEIHDVEDTYIEDLEAANGSTMQFDAPWICGGEGSKGSGSYTIPGDFDSDHYTNLGGGRYRICED